MAISGTHYRLLCSLRDKLPHGGSLLEIGEANWYGDIAPDFPCPPNANGFDIAKACYASIFEPCRTVAVDINGSLDALRYDLNAPLPLDEQFDVVINHGTAEHVFNIGQVFKSMHDHCIAGGLMIHEGPFTGWIDHGFYCLQPTLYYDLAAANHYEVTLVAIEEPRSGTIIRVNGRDHIAHLTPPENSMLYVALRKWGDAPFRVPFQGYYGQTLSETGNRAWEARR